MRRIEKVINVFDYSIVKIFGAELHDMLLKKTRKFCGLREKLSKKMNKRKLIEAQVNKDKQGALLSNLNNKSINYNSRSH